MKLSKKGKWLFFAWFVSVIATSGSLYLSEVLGYTPCELCWFQRIFMYPLVCVLGIASYRQQTVIIPYTVPLLAVGGSISIYHILIQKLPHDSAIAACGPTSCLDDYLNWFGWLTIPMLALAAFILIGVSLLQAWRIEKRTAAE
ncbi:disulfide bond formation protein DsbB [Paenibacillus oryzae]|uniref:Disulfide bond formation protein DsbB n=1 Tax=Paenibacillus oryzae TaxID=1844972 RepID=A0A1A5YDZ4_9BACL|nr:disulfide bond formation protein DsbB [Paenibacillus oryzae]